MSLPTAGPAHLGFTGLLAGACTGTSPVQKAGAGTSPGASQKAGAGTGPGTSQKADACTGISQPKGWCWHWRQPAKRQCQPEGNTGQRAGASQRAVPAKGPVPRRHRYRLAALKDGLKGAGKAAQGATTRRVIPPCGWGRWRRVELRQRAVGEMESTAIQSLAPLSGGATACLERRMLKARWREGSRVTR